MDGNMRRLSGKESRVQINGGKIVEGGEWRVRGKESRVRRDLTMLNSGGIRVNSEGRRGRARGYRVLISMFAQVQIFV